MQLSRGQRTKLSDIGLSDNLFKVKVDLDTRGLSVDAACFGLDGAKKLSDERYMTFFNQPTSPCGGVKLDGSGVFAFNLTQLPEAINSLCITLAIDGVGQMSKLGQCKVSFLRGNHLVGGYEFNGSHFAAERAIMLLDIYRKDGNWRLCAVGQGFNGGLDALVTHFGGAVVENPTDQATPTPMAPLPSPKVSLSKVVLEKRGEKISLEKRGSGAGHGKIVCNLNWSRPPIAEQKKGFLGNLLGGKPKGIDLDLGCLYEMADGSKSVVQALGNQFGAFNSPPYIHMAGDDRTGANINGEFLYINGDHLRDLKRVCIFAFIYEGVANWGQADGMVTLTIPEHPPIEVRLDNHDNSKNMCAIAMLEDDAGSLKITKLGEYFSGHLDLDMRYDWGMRWVAGSK